MQYGTPLLLLLYSSVWSTVGTAVCHDFTAVVIGQRIVVLRTYGNVSEFFTEKITVTWLFYQLASRSASRQYMGSPSDSSFLEQSLAACGKIAMSFPLKIWTHTWFLGSTWVYAVYGISITSAIFAELTVCGCVYMSVMLEICKRPVWFGFSLECDSITHLLQAQINIQSCQYLPALLELFAAHTKLNTWQSLLTARDVGVRSLCC